METKTVKHIVRWLGYGILLIPLVYMPWLLFPLTFGKAVTGQMLVGLAVLFASVVWLREPESRPHWNWVWGIISVFLLVQLLAAVFGVNLHISLWSDISRALGVIVMITAAVAVLIYSSPIMQQRDWDRYMISMIGVGAVVIVLAITQHFSPDILPNFAVDRVSSTLGNPIFYAGYLLLMIIPGYYVWRLRTKQWHTIALVGLALLALLSFVWAQSRGATLGLLVICAIIAAFGLSGKIKRAQWFFRGVLGVVVLVSVGLIMARNHPAIVKSPFSGWVGTTTLQTRVVNWGMAIDGVIARPLLGWGPENYKEAVAAHFDPALTQLSFQETFVDKPHNFFLEIAATSGVIGLSTYLALWFALCMVVIALYRSGEMLKEEAVLWIAVGAGYAVHLFFLFETVSSLFVIIPLVAWLLWRYQKNHPAKEDKKIVVSPTVTWIAVAVLILGIGTHLYRNVISPIISAYRTNLGIQYMYLPDWLEARKYFFAAYDLHTPYVFERWRKPAEAAARFVFADSPHKSVVDIPVSWRDTWIEDQKRISAYGEELYAENPDYNNAVFLGKWYYQTGIGLNDQELLDRAEELFFAAHELSPMREEPLLLLTQYYILADKGETAVEIADKVVAQSPDFGMSYWFKGTALLVANQPATAVESFNTAIDLGFHPQIEQYDTAVIQLQEQNAYKEIVELYEYAVQTQFSGDVEVHRRLAVAYATVGDIESAKKVALRVQELDPRLASEVAAFIASLEETITK